MSGVNLVELSGLSDLFDKVHIRYMKERNLSAVITLIYSDIRLGNSIYVSEFQHALPLITPNL